MQDLPHSRTSALLKERTGHFAVSSKLLPYIWPSNRPYLRCLVVFALAALVAAKAITLAVPIAYKQVVDWLTGHASGAGTAAESALGLAAVPAMLIVAYGV